MVVVVAHCELTKNHQTVQLQWVNLMVDKLYLNKTVNKKVRKETLNQKKKKIRDFLGGPVVKNPPSNAGNAGSIPGQGTKIPHTADN